MADDHRVPRAAVAGLEGFARLQRLHEAAVDCIDDRLDELTPGMRALTVLFAYVGGVDNGGFASCMYNSTGDLTGEAIAAARRIQAGRHASVFERFAALGMGGDLTLDRDAREQRLEAMTDAEEEALEELDEEFYALPNVDEALDAYIDEHPEEFFKD